MKYLVVIPTYNEKENISDLIIAIKNLSLSLDILIVDDNSPDNTAGLVENLQNKYSDSLFLKKRPGKLGLGSAYQEAFEFAREKKYDFVISMDADFSHNPKDIIKLVEQSQNFDIVLASRKIKGGQIVGWNAWRHLTSNGAMAISRLILSLNTKDVTAGFKCYNRKFLDFLKDKKIKSNGYAFQIEMIYIAEKNNFRIKEIPSVFLDREKGKSKLSAKDAIEFFINVFKLRFTPLNKFK
ncbi:polyprenol monophosphomannose synthase [Patescibacteria group bacterium]|nr:polyprenol monophosphomannose synthase [Patescibacteria group bacterium]